MIRVLAVAASLIGVLVLTASATAVPGRTLHGLVVVSKDGDGEGRVTSVPDGIDCGSRCTFSFLSTDDPGYQPVTLFAKAEPGSAFEGWNLCGEDKCTIDPVQRLKTYEVNATFVRARPTQFPLAVTLTGSGTVTSSPSGINCGGTCSAMFATDSTVTLTATPTPGWSFTGWSGACTGTGACGVKMADPRAVTATFAPPDTVYAVAVAAAGGSVTSDVPGIVCGEACVASFGAGIDVTLTASGSVAWGGACTGTGACVVPLTRARSVTAAIGGAQPSRAPLAVSVTGKGSISGPAAGISCGTACGVLLPLNTRVTLRATPEAGWVFAGWSGSCRGVAPLCSLTARFAATAVASFVEAGTVFPVVIAKVGRGTVKSSPPGINCGRTCSRAFPAGTTATIEATPDPKWTFVRWTGACTGRKPVCTLAMDGAKSASATFGRVADPNPPRVTALASEGERGEVVQLRYRVVEAGGASRETATVFRGTRRLATIQGRAHEVEADTLFYFLPWRSTVAGKLRFCVVSTDTAGNRSKRSCAPLLIST